MLKSLLMVLYYQLYTFTALIDLDSGLAEKVINKLNFTVISNPLDYCIATNYTIKAELIVVKDNGDWMMINNGTTNLILFPTNITDCEGYNPNIIIYAAQNIIGCVVILLFSCMYYNSTLMF